MHIGKKNPRTPYFMSDIQSGKKYELTKTDVERDLGVYITHNLKNKEQVSRAAGKANSKLGMLTRTFVSRDAKLWKNLYTTYVRPNMEFAVSAWNPYAKGDIKLLEQVQHRATRIPHSLRGLDYKTRCARLDLCTHEQRRKRGDLIQRYKIEKGIDEENWHFKPTYIEPRANHRGHYQEELIKNCQ